LALFLTTSSVSCFSQIIHLYNPGRDQAAQQIKSNFAKVDISAVLRMQDTNLTAIAAVELDTIKTLAIMKRDAVLFDVIQATNIGTDFFANTIAKRLELLGKGFSSTSFSRLTNGIVSERTFRAHLDDLANQALDFQAEYGVGPPPFEYRASNCPTANEWFTGASSFVADDIADTKSLAAKLKSPGKADPASFLKSHLSAITTNLLDNYHGETNKDLPKALADDLNQMVAGGSIYDTNVFAGVKLSPETSKMVSQKPQGAAAVRFNILLILDAFPEIAPDRFAKRTPSRKADKPAAYSLYAETYSNLLTDVAATGKTEGLLANALRDLFDAEAELAKDKTAADVAANGYKEAVAAYNMAATNQPLLSASEKISQAASDFNGTLGTINSNLQILATNGGVFGRLAAITNELAAIDEIIGAATSTNVIADTANITDPNLKKAALIASTLPGILDKSVALGQAIQKPPLLALLIDRDILLVQKQMAENAIDRQNRTVTLRQQLFQARLSEVNLLLDIVETKGKIQTEYEGSAKTNSTMKNPLDLATIDALGTQTKDSWKTDLQEALLKYAETVRVSQYHVMLAQYGLTHLTYEQANDSREGAAQMWNSLIANPINALAQYHAGGVKPETIADILSKFFIGSAILAK
jgi:hypothetical protein